MKRIAGAGVFVQMWRDHPPFLQAYRPICGKTSWARVGPLNSLNLALAAVALPSHKKAVGPRRTKKVAPPSNPRYGTKARCVPGKSSEKPDDTGSAGKRDVTCCRHWKTLTRSSTRKWRNWQTRRTQDPVG